MRRDSCSATINGAVARSLTGTRLATIPVVPSGNNAAVSRGTTLGGRPHTCLEPFFAKLTAERNNTLLVAAAGNDGSSNMFYPAAYAPLAGDAVVSVGALRGDRKGRACFSNYGDWVKVFALGERHHNAFMTGGYLYQDPHART